MRRPRLLGPWSRRQAAHGIGATLHTDGWSDMPLVWYAPGVPGPGPTPDPPPRPRAPGPQTWELVISRGGESLELPSVPTGNSKWIITPGVYGLDMPQVSVIGSRVAGMWGGHSSDI